MDQHYLFWIVKVLALKIGNLGSTNLFYILLPPEVQGVQEMFQNIFCTLPPLPHPQHYWAAIGGSENCQLKGVTTNTHTTALMKFRNLKDSLQEVRGEKPVFLLWGTPYKLSVNGKPLSLM